MAKVIKFDNHFQVIYGMIKRQILTISCFTFKFNHIHTWGKSIPGKRHEVCICFPKLQTKYSKENQPIGTKYQYRALTTLNITNLFFTPFSFPLRIQYLISDFTLCIKKNCHFIKFLWIFAVFLTPRRCGKWKVQFLQCFSYQMKKTTETFSCIQDAHIHLNERDTSDWQPYILFSVKSDTNGRYLCPMEHMHPVKQKQKNLQVAIL